MSNSDWILLATLLVVAAYTWFTYRLWKQQGHQFRLSQRPWVYPGDVTINNDPTLPQLGILLQNFGKLPAQCRVLVRSITLKPLPELPETGKLISQEEAREMSIFPFVSGVDSVFMFLIALTPEQNRLLVDDCRIEIELNISYKALTDSSSNFPFSYSAVLEVSKLKRAAGRQATLIRGAVAK